MIGYQCQEQTVSASEHKSPERVSEEAGAAGACEVLLSGLLAVLELLLEAAGAVLTRLPLAYEL